MKTHHATMLHPRAKQHGEGACWWAARRQLIWVDILACEVHLYDPAQDEDRMWSVPCQVGFAHPTETGDLILGTREGIARLDLRGNEITFLVDPEAHLKDTRFNEGKPGPDGRLFAGSMSDDKVSPLGSLWLIEKDLSARQLLDNVAISNGLCWSHDEQTMYYIDSPTRRVEAFDYDAATGSLKNRRTVVEVPDGLGKPDGMTIDVEGNLWVALYGGGMVACYDPIKGKMIERVLAPCPGVTCPTFGGPGLETLYFTTSRLNSEQLAPKEATAAGHIFAAEPGVQGCRGTVFGG
ncbi:SMP-30/gluconolactonase/LRE family protein [Ruficoccus amylovorans]|uniref:SMP-30/gluconolactonase/LRE family protein n=1 Tax=Ruficoccus amylovorans TaxID=1804625 RepID=A0A842HJ86_9BACT|nr:SMP-30/gluconolactonase/LRE family protein [Ruficoccus amylovorans]MBC2596449.1 SMP-30/gluconolactonase/LRE family protein [Ruficoccus amylovorans]